MHRQTSNIIGKGCGCSAPCGCGDHVLNTPLCSSNNPGCDSPDQCPETFSSNCALYMGDTIANLDIKKGDPLTTVIQKLVLAIVNPGCAYPDSPCKGVTGLGSYGISTTTIKLSWDEVVGATGYQVEFREVNSPTWLLNPAVTTLKDTIGTLTSNTSYYVRVKTNCGVNACYSAVLIITTQP